jgi:hypothetical protein
LNGQKRRSIKGLLILLALAGFAIAVYSAIDSQAKKVMAQQQAASVSEQLRLANGSLDTQGRILNLVDLTVADLGMLNRLSGGNKYYVRIAADTVRDRLERYQRAIENQFKGARESGLVVIRDPKSGSRNFELVFGNHLDVAAAEVFQRLANSNGFPPAGQGATIQPEPASGAH